MLFRMRPLLAVLAFAGALSFLAADAGARAGKGGSSGSRGAKTYSAPPTTNTAPTTARPIERSMAQPAAPTRAPAAPAAGGLFGRSGFLGGLAAGFLGAGLLGLLFGGGLFGGLGGLASILGLIIQVALVVVVARLAWVWWQRRSQAQGAYAGGAPPSDASARSGLERLGLGSLGGGAGAGAGWALGGGASSAAVQPTAADFDRFEALLKDVQTAYGREDRQALQERVTPEMLSYFSQELDDNASRGVRNELSDVTLLQGDLAEAWREGEQEYATVAMRYSLLDRTLDRASGRVMEGDPTRPVEATELWTFVREHGGDWRLSAIQQV